MRTSMGAIAGAMMAALVTLPAPVRAADEVLRLVYTRSPAAAQCPPESLLHDEVARRLGRDPFTSDASNSLTLDLSRRGGEFVAIAKMRDDGGQVLWEQPLHDPDCKVLVSAMAAGIALELTPLVLPSESAAPPPAPSAPAPAPRPAPTAKPPAPAAPPPRPAPLDSPAHGRREASSGPRIEIGAGVFGALGRSPVPSLGPTVSTALRWPLVSIALDGRFLLPIGATEIQSRTGKAADLRYSLLSASVGPCVHAGALFLCLPVELGLRDATSSADVRVHEDTPATIMLGLRAGGDWVLSQRFTLRSYLEASGALKPTIILAEDREVWRAPRVSGLLTASIVHTP